MTFEQFIAREMYVRVRGLGDRLELMKEQLDWKPFCRIVASVYHDGTSAGGRPHTDDVVIVRALLLQSWFSLSDEELEFQCADRLSFRNFLGHPERVPDFTTIWSARERLIKAGKFDALWAELQRQIDEKGFAIKKGVIQDASFIEAERGRARQAREKKAEKEGKKIKYTEKQRAHQDKDGTYAVKQEQVHYGYKLHQKMDVDHQLIRDVATTTASQHDNTINLIKDGDVAGFRDKGYFGTALPKNVVDETMGRNVRGRKLNGGQLRRNARISKIRSPGERPFGVIKETFHGGVVYVTTLARVHAKNTLWCFAYNLYQLVTLRRKTLFHS